MDELSYKFFDDPAKYARAVELLARYEKVEHLSWEKAEAYLDGLDEAESDLLDRALEYRTARQKSHQALVDEVAELRQTVAALSAGLPIQPSRFPPSPINAASQSGSSIPAPSPNEDDLLLSTAIEHFLEYKRQHIKKVSWTTIEFKTRWFLQILTEHNDGRIPRVSELNHPRLREFRKTLLKVPKNRRNLPKDCSIEAMLKMNLPPITQQTAHTTCMVVGELLTWIQAEGYPIQRDLKGVLASVKKPKVTEKNKRITFEPEDLKLLFASDRYHKGRVTRASEYWVPLMALFTGARLGELVQFECSDIYENQGVWVFDINDDSGKQLKTEKSRRLVPIHSTLIELGFLDFVKCRGKTHRRLFPEEERNGEGKFDSYTKRFAYYRKKIGVLSGDKEMLDFHSFRHTVRTKLAEASIQESLIDDIIGHTPKNASVGKTVYTHTQLIPQKKEAIEKLVFDLDFSKMKRWEHCRFARDLRKPQSASSRKN